VDLDFTAEQDLLRESVRRSCERHCDLDTVRSLEDDEVGYSPAFWQQLADLGVLGLLIDERFGGSGTTMLDSAVVYEELGRAIAPSPHFVSCVLAAGLIGRSSNHELKARVLPAIANGGSVVTVASAEVDRGPGRGGVQLVAARDGDGWLLSGTKVHVPFARAADSIIVLARAPGDDDASSVVAAIVPTAASGVTCHQQLAIASDAQFQVEFDRVRVEPEEVLHLEAWPAWHDTMLDGITLLAAQAAGGARAALELAIGYARTREQFGKPLAGFQSISHYLADATTAVDGAEALTWEAAWARCRGRSIERLAPMAKSYACATFRDVTATAQQIFGGNGFTVDFDIQLYFRRAKSLQLNHWDERYLNELIAADVLDRAESSAS
jgi:alkylation response protein AidB-like acyl-CoA dehydrogenase